MHQIEEPVQQRCLRGRKTKSILPLMVFHELQGKNADEIKAQDLSKKRTENANPSSSFDVHFQMVYSILSQCNTFLDWRPFLF